jgi:predicted metal-dependent peptidase
MSEKETKKSKEPQGLVPVDPENPFAYPDKKYSETDKKNALQNAIYKLTLSEAFYGNLLQELTIKYTMQVPTAGITFNQKASQYEVYIYPQFFLSLTNEQRVATFQHEVLHFTNKHLFRLPFLDANIADEDKKLYNIAGDMAINQFIRDLPKGCVDVAQWKLDDGSAFPTFQNMETYNELIKSEKQKQKKNGKDQGEGKGGDKTKGNVNEQMDKYREFDKHMWDSLDEETKKKMLEEAKKLIKRTVEKTSYSHSIVPDSVKDLLDEIDKLSFGINYKQILKAVLKRTVCSSDREGTWKRPNKRYGVYSPGTRVGNLPNLSMFVDTSGSISVNEMNEFFNIISGFLKVGSRHCFLGLWHTALYYKKKFKLNGQLMKEDLQSGGTDITPAMLDIKKTNPNLAIILTDGYFGECNVKITSEIIFIISKGGNKDHPLKHVGKTILLEHLK